MKSIVRRSIGFLGVAVMATQLVGSPATVTGSFPGSSGSFEQAMPVTPAQKEVERLFQQISGRAAIVSKHVDRLDSFMRGSRYAYTSHASELMGAREAINAMGADLRLLQE